MITVPPQTGAAELRLFFALWPDPAQRSAVAAAAALLPAGAGERLVAPAQYHVTLAFIGAVPASCLDVVRGIGLQQRATQCALRFDAYEYWPKPEVVVAAVRVIPPALEAVWSGLHANLADAGFDLRPKNLRPHITLARKVTQAPVLPGMSRLAWTPRSFSLVRSEITAAGSVYTVVDTWPLLDKTTAA